MFMLKHHLNKHGQCTINIGDSAITPAQYVHNMGVQVDQHLSMISHVTVICASCTYHLCRPSSIRRYLTAEANRTVIQALITSHLDHCHSLMINIPSTQIECLQKIQNKAARMVLRVPSHQHILPPSIAATTLSSCVLSHKLQDPGYSVPVHACTCPYISH